MIDIEEYILKRIYRLKNKRKKIWQTINSQGEEMSDLNIYKIWELDGKITENYIFLKELKRREERIR